ncbi:MAG: MarR family transcriptional regulator [Bryobacterales bacterium]|nr:MarR family transcriptional regulator [Bryobacterales bacterium]
MENGTGVLFVSPGLRESPLRNPAGQLLGAARILCLAVQETVESKLQQDLAGDRLSHSQWKLLEIFATTAVGNVTEVAAYQGVSTAAASKAVDRLVRLNLLARAEDPSDRRHIRLSLTVEGRTLTAEYLERLNRKLAEIFASADAGPLAPLREALDKLTASVLGAASNASQICVQCGLNGRESCLMEDAFARECLFHAVHRPLPPANEDPPMRRGESAG